MIQHDGAAGENESPDSHPDHCGQENARLSGLNIVPRVQVQVVEDMGGHLGSSLADSEYYGSGTVVLAVSFWHGNAPQDARLLLFHPSSEARRLLAESGEQKEIKDVGFSSLAV